MAVALDASSESHTGTTGSTSAASFTWNHTIGASAKGVLVFVFNASAAADTATSVTIGGVTVPPCAAAGIATDTATEPGFVKAFFLGSGLPAAGAQAVVVNRTNNTNVMYAIAITVTAAGNTAITNSVRLQEDGTLAEQSVNDWTPGANSMRFAGLYSGLAAPPSAGASSTLLQSITLAANICAAVRETTAGQGARNVGFTSATSDDRAAIHLAVIDVPANTPYVRDSTRANATSTSATTALPLTVQNDRMLAYVTVYASSVDGSHPAVTTPGGWALVGALASTSADSLGDRAKVWVYEKTATASEAAPTFTIATSQAWALSFLTAGGVITRDVFTQDFRVNPTNNAAGMSTTYTLPTALTAAAKELYLLHAVDDQGQVISSGDTGYTRIHNIAGPAYLGYKIVASPGTSIGGETLTWAAAVDSHSSLITLSPTAFSYIFPHKSSRNPALRR